jgi:predicted RNase H-like HicB family nuclease
MRYAVIIERSETGFGAYAPDLPGCVAAGATRDEVVELIQEAIEFHIEGLKQDGQPVRRVAHDPCIEPRFRGSAA